MDTRRPVAEDQWLVFCWVACVHITQNDPLKTTELSTHVAMSGLLIIQNQLDLLET